MRIPLVFLAVLAGTGCTPAGSFQGKLVNAMSGEPIPDIRLLAKSEDTSDLTCQVFEATTGSDGTFSLDGLCGGTTYTIRPTEATLLLEGVSEVPGGQPATGVQEVKAWVAPAGSGVYLLEEGELRSLSTKADVGSAYIWESDEETVRYPKTLPKKIPHVGKDDHLVLAGSRAIKKMKFHPLVKSDERKFGSREEPEESEPWWYIGVKFESDTEYERITVRPDKAKVLDVKVDDAHVQYLPTDALPPGHYALLADMDRRTYLVTFGPPRKPPGVDAEEE